METLKNSWEQLRRYPSAIAGLVIIALLVITAVYAMVTIPYNDAIRLWRGGEDVWYKNPKFAAPEWTNLFSAQKLPTSFSASSMAGTMTKKVGAMASDGTTPINITYSFDFPWDGNPQEVILYFTTKFASKPHISASSFRSS